MTATTKNSYHHGDLHAALLTTAMGMLEMGEPFSLRSVARKAGVSAAAPYRHFPDRDALESALAAQGLRDLKADLTPNRQVPRTVEEFADLGVSYVEFAIRRPALFRLMFGKERHDEDADRVRAAAEVRELLATAITRVFPASDPITVVRGGWGLVHGLACLYLDRHLSTPSTGDLAAEVRASLLAMLTAQSHSVGRVGKSSRTSPPTMR
jgi:AcrR family transcriptional regulator